MKSILPNAITLSNLLCGCLALICIFNQEIGLVPVFLTIALAADYIDGFVARLMGVHSELGKQLDSLADMVSFGVVPGALLYYLINQTFNIQKIDFENVNTLYGIVGFIVTLFSCLRLAKFNLDDRQSDSFVGLNTPSCTVFVIGITLIAHYDLYTLREYVLQAVVLFPICFILSYLLVAEIPMFSFKFKNLQWSKNKFRLSFLISVILLLSFLKLGLALAIIILNYVVFSLILWGMGILSLPKRVPSDRSE